MRFIKISFAILAFYFAGIFAGAFAVSDAPANRLSIFFEANKAYHDGNYELALSKYEELIRTGTVGGDIYYNLGNCYFRIGQIGRAILNYERAKRILPKDADLDFNLRFAKDQIVDKIPQAGFTWIGWVDNFSMSELFFAFVIINMILWGIFIIRIRIKSEWTFYVMTGAIMLWLVVSMSWAMKWYNFNYDNRAVVVAPEIIVHAGPSEKDTTLFKFHAGTIVTCERTESDWLLINLNQQQRGWAKSSEVIPIVNKGL